MEALRLVPGLSWPGDGTLLAEAFACLSRARSEFLIVTFHNGDGRFICATQRSGGVGKIDLNYRDLIENALANRAAGLLLIHNHPSGDHTPSVDDIVATRALAALCRPLQLLVHDHLVVGSKALTSLARAGLMELPRKTAA